ncbi:MAG: radical SAM protein [Bdellovibrionia bacterium]
MELRRFKDIIAFKWGQNAPLAFHSLNMEVAEISQQAFEAMQKTALDKAEVLNLPPEALTEDLSPAKSLLEWQNSQNTEAKDVSLGNKIKSLTLNVTQICNLHCTYCAAGGDGTYGEAITKLSVEKTLPQLKYFLEKLSAGDNFHITFLGGEPLLYPQALVAIHNYVTLFSAGKNIQISYSIITNGTLITEELLKTLAPLKAQYTLSFDGPQEVQDLLRPQKKGGSSFEQTFKGYKLLLENPNLRGRLLIHSVFSKQNTDVVKSYKFFAEFGFDAIEFTFDVTEDDSQVSLAFTKSLMEAAALAYERGGEQELRKITLYDNYFRLLDAQTRNWNYCGSGKTLLSIDAANRVFTCPLAVSNKSESVGNGVEISQNQIQELSSNLVELNNCQNCWAKTLCGGGCMFVHQSTTGNKHKKSISYCERQRNLIINALMYYQLSRAEKGPYDV